MVSKEQGISLGEYWQRHIAAWEQSGQTQKAFCLAHDLDYYRFGYWRRKFLESDEAKNNPPSDFVPVSYQPSGADCIPGLSLMLPSGLRIQGIAPENLPLVYQLLGRLS